MSDPTAIEEVQERFADLLEALHEQGREDLASMLEAHGSGFTSLTAVRRSVTAIEDQLRRWREDVGGLPEAPAVQLAANRLEDACRDALQAGVIVPARPSLATRSRRKLSVVLGALALGGVILLIPVLVVELGVDLEDLGATPELPPLELPQGEEAEGEAKLLHGSENPQATSGVEIGPAGECTTSYPDGSSCVEVTPRLWPGGRRKTFELRLPDQAYGLLFSIVDPVFVRGVGEARLLLAATDDTPEGMYRLRLEGAYVGYRPACGTFERLLGNCETPHSDAELRHGGLPAPVIVVKVTRGDPNKRLGEKRLEQAQREEEHRRAEQRAKELASVLSELTVEMDKTEQLLKRRKHEEARERVDALAVLFEPLRNLAVAETDTQVLEAKARFDQLCEKLDTFESKVFEAAFKRLNNPDTTNVDESKAMERVARRYRISPEYLTAIYTGRADEIQRRLDEMAEARKEAQQAERKALEARCGTLPTGAWKTVAAYLENLTSDAELTLGECMTPRLNAEDCWMLQCDFKESRMVAIELPKVVRKLTGRFFLRNGKVVRHQAVH